MPILLHIVRSMKSTGKAACILPHGVLFRGNAEATIREQLIRSGYLKGIIGLPANSGPAARKAGGSRGHRGPLIRIPGRSRRPACVAVDAQRERLARIAGTYGAFASRRLSTSSRDKVPPEPNKTPFHLCGETFRSTS